MRRFLDLPSGIGLVVANMIGAGVLLSAGFMAQELRPREILAAWVAGAVLATATALLCPDRLDEIEALVGSL